MILCYLVFNSKLISHCSSITLPSPPTTYVPPRVFLSMFYLLLFSISWYHDILFFISAFFYTSTTLWGFGLVSRHKTRCVWGEERSFKSYQFLFSFWCEPPLTLRLIILKLLLALAAILGKYLASQSETDRDKYLPSTQVRSLGLNRKVFWFEQK